VGAYHVDNVVFWDNWVQEDKGVLHRFALAAYKAVITDSNDRHEHAFIQHALSSDAGKTWVDQGPCVVPSLHQGRWPDHVIWKGSILKRVENGRTVFYHFITGRDHATGMLQKIGLVKSSDGCVHEDDEATQPTIVLDATNAETAAQVEEYDYSLAGDETNQSGKGNIPAWRDPVVFLDPTTSNYTMLFAAKKKLGCGQVGNVVGRAEATDKTLLRWKLQKALTLPPPYYEQLEVPQVIRRNHQDGSHYYVFISTHDSPLGTTNKEKNSAFRGYVAASLEGPWHALSYRTDGDSNKIFGSEVFAPTVHEKVFGEGDWSFSTFFSEHTPYPLIGTPLYDIKWQMNTLRHELPIFALPQDVLGPDLQ